MKIEFGTTKKGEKASCYILKNKNGMEAVVSDYGAALLKLLVPDKNGKLCDVVLGYETLEDYENGGDSIGATVGRVANRIGTGEFELNGTVYSLTKNDNGKNTLHGGCDFYNKRMWNAKNEDDQQVTFTLTSPDGDQGFPVELKIEVTYTVTDDNELKIHYHAVPDKDTIVNLTNHSYFNLPGHASGSALDEEVWINADMFTEADEESIPTGIFVPVEGTPMDFRNAKTVEKEIGGDYIALRYGNGYDHNWVLNGEGFRKVAAAYSEKTGIKMEVSTDLPGMQFYSGNFLVETKGKDGAVYDKGHGICFETQYFPDAIHKDNFKSPVVRAGESYETTTIYKFV